MQKRHFVIRTIRNGQVKINGRIFKPDNLFEEAMKPKEKQQ